MGSLRTHIHPNFIYEVSFDTPSGVLNNPKLFGTPGAHAQSELKILVEIRSIVRRILIFVHTHMHVFIHLYPFWPLEITLSLNNY